VTIKVLIVDDSQFFCKTIGTGLNQLDEIKIVGVAHNGKEAVEKAQKFQPDVITLDVEMPIMDGLTAISYLQKVCDAHILMLSSLTYENARVTLDALEAGAADFMLKSYEALSSHSGALIEILQNKVLELGKDKLSLREQPKKSEKKVLLKTGKEKFEELKQSFQKLKSKLGLITIGSSTGGPVALQKLLSALPKNFPVPLVITQHIPPTFSGVLSSRLNEQSELEIAEANDGDQIMVGKVYIAPGGKQLYFEQKNGMTFLRVRDSDSRIQFAPSVDVTFASAAKIYGQNLLAIVMTGMGADGLKGCQLINQHGGSIWTQDKSSCVVYGMPKAVDEAGLSDARLSLEQLTELFGAT